MRLVRYWAVLIMPVVVSIRRSLDGVLLVDELLAYLCILISLLQASSDTLYLDVCTLAVFAVSKSLKCLAKTKMNR